MKSVLTIVLATIASVVLAEPELKGAKQFLPFEGLEYGKMPAEVPTGCPEFEIDLPRARPGVVRAIDFGFSATNRYNAVAITRAIAYAKEIGAGKVELAPGVYRCHDVEGIRIFGAKDLEIDGKGACLVFYRPSVFRDVTYWEIEISTDYGSFRIIDCERLRIHDLNVDWDWEVDPLAERARVVGRNFVDGKPKESYVELDFIDYQRHPGYPDPISIQTFAELDESTDPVRFAQTGGCSYSGTQEGHFGMKTEWVSPNRIRIFPGAAPTDPRARMHKDNFKHVYSQAKGTSRFFQKKLKDGALFRTSHYYVGKNCFDMRSNAHLTLERVNVYSCRGDAFHIEGKQHHWQLVDVSVWPPKDVTQAGGGPAVRPMTTSLDVMHIGRSCGYSKLIRFRCTMNQDDHANFHDRFSAVRRTGPREVEINQGRGNAYFQAEVGTTLEFRNRDFSPAGFSAKVTQVVNDVFLRFDRDIPERFAGEGAFVFDKSYGTANLWIEGCEYMSCWGRFLTLAKNVTFKDCTWKDGIASAIMIQEGINYGFWAEGFGCSNIVVRGCTFDSLQRFNRTGFGGVVQDVFIGANATDHHGELKLKVWPGILTGIMVENCRFLNPRGACWHAANGENLIFRNNEITVDRPDANMLPYRGSIVIEDAAKNVYVSGNRYRTSDGKPAGLILR